MATKKCKWCGREFKDNSVFGLQVYCSEKCKREAKK
jgi:hypothetical protein